MKIKIILNQVNVSKEPLYLWFNKFIVLSNSLFINYIENDNNNIINKLKKLFYIYNRSVIKLKYKYFYKYCYIINKLKTDVLKNNNKYEILIVRNINNKKIKRNISNDNPTYNTHKIPINNIYIILRKNIYNF